MEPNDNRYRLHWLVVMRYRGTRFVLFGVGPWHRHLMDWRGCNHYHGRIPGSPTFATIEEAAAWADKEARAGRLRRGMELTGHHAGENECSKCKDADGFSREVGTISLVEVGKGKRTKRGARLTEVRP